LTNCSLNSIIKSSNEREVKNMFTVIYTKDNTTKTETFGQYFQALTFGINLQNNGYTVEIKRN
jgi:hypothetical protein